MKRLNFAVMTTCVLLCASVAGAAGGDEEEIRGLEAELRLATLNNDLVATDRLLAEDWVNTNADGSVTTKPQLMALLRASPFKFKSIENADVVVRFFGDAAVVTGRSVRERPGQDGKVTAQQVRFTRVYARRRGGWQVVAAQATPVAQP